MSSHTEISEATFEFEDSSEIEDKRREEIESLLNPAIDVNSSFNTKIQNIQSYLTKLLERNTIAMNACANSQFVSISKTIQDYTEFLGKVDSIVLNDPEIKSLDSSIEWYKDKVSRLQRKSDNYGQRLESFKHNCEAIQGTRKELEAKLKSIRLENMRLEFKAKQQKLREQSSSVLKTGLLNSCNDSRMLRSKCSSIYTNLSPAFEILLSSEDLETANVYTERVSNLKQDITSARRKIQNINKDEGIHRKRPLEMSEFFQQCFNSVFNQLLSAQEIESNRDMKLYLLIKQESGSPRHSRNTDEFRQFMRSNKGYSPRSDTTVSFDALEKKMKKIDREMKYYNLHSGSMTWSEFISLRFEQFFLLLALRPNIVKDVRKAICDVKVISSLVKLDKSSLTFSPRSLRQEFCNLYVAKLKVRTNQKGEIAAV